MAIGERQQNDPDTLFKQQLHNVCHAATMRLLADPNGKLQATRTAMETAGAYLAELPLPEPTPQVASTTEKPSWRNYFK